MKPLSTPLAHLCGETQGMGGFAAQRVSIVDGFFVTRGPLD